jgi:hypothetical protein
VGRAERSPDFQNARIALIPDAPGGASTLNVYVYAAQGGDLVGAACAGPFPPAYVGVPNQLLEVDISGDLAPRIGVPGQNYLAVFAYSTPTTATDHVVGLRFAYDPEPPVVTSGNVSLPATTRVTTTPPSATSHSIRIPRGLPIPPPVIRR